MALEAGFDEIDSLATRSGTSLPRDGSIDLCLDHTAAHTPHAGCDRIVVAAVGVCKWV
jgi:hypothetical protein